MTSSPSSPTMIGRDTDLAWLSDLLLGVRAGTPATAIIGGEAGIGKSRLVREFTAGLGPDVRLILGQCVDLGEVAAPYAPIKGALRALVAQVGADRVLEAVGPGRAALIALLPELATSGGATAGEIVITPGGAGSGQLHEAVAVLLETLSRDEPIVLVIEDLHWVDAATLGLLRFLLRSLGSSRVLLLLTYRSDDVTRGHPLRGFLTEVERDRWVERRELGRLSHDEVRDLVRTLLADDALSEQALDTVFARSDGVPFFVEELVGIDGCRDEGFVPDTLRDLLLARYERLPDAAQAFLRLLSTGGVRVPHALLAAVDGGDEGALDAAARESVRYGVIEIDGDDYAFRHALVREAILADLLPGERARFHARYAEAYEAQAAAGGRRLAAEISYHWLGAHDPVRAFPATIQAMREARAAVAYASAAQLGERALELWQSVPDPEQVSGMGKLELMGRTASYLRHAGEGERSLAMVKAALAECPPDDEQYPRLLRDKALYLAGVGRPGSIAILEEALAALPADDSDDLRATILTALAGRLMIEARIDDAVRVAGEAFELAERIDFPRYASVAMNIAAVSRAARGEVDRALVDIERARELAKGEGSALLRYWVNASDLRNLVGDYHEAVRLAEEGLDRARRQGVERSSGVILASNAVDPLFALGEWDRADALIERGLALDPPAPFRVYLQRAKLWALVWRGDAERAAELLRSSRATMTPIMAVEMQTRLGVQRVAVEIGLAVGDVSQAWRDGRGVLHEAQLPLAGYAEPLMWALARVIAAVRADPMRVSEAEAAEILDAEPALRELVDRLAFWPTHAMWAAFVDAELQPTEAAWRAAADAARAETAPGFLLPYAELRLGEALLADGDRVGAREALQAAFDSAVAGGVTAVQTRAARVAMQAAIGLDGATSGDVSRGSAGVAGADDAADAVAELTARERQVLDLIAEGLSNRQIGERLYISGKTASVHVSAILRKLGASSRTEAVFLARVAR
ncbi:ATP/maltotriose-dependent transcriptional regulator MalT [Agromyces flavus]|uniref:ATP/maltotriose-dependent transcriptional regulator MalT n=1 Tax=Agromyces flavus TaxID=589382 RepID=A0ABT1KIN0_9MICO|nr:LuxR family transcriptional regulator [Agromyces flavus]MCP2366748.1 ATP/maltotriose-dependent transcriptional regulator MalT [Agromyces flavus]